MDIGFHELLDNNRRNFCLYGIGILVGLQTIFMLAAVIILANIAPEIKTTLTDVNTMLPEMRRSLLDFGQVMPEIKTSIKILSQLCTASDNCYST
jgi:phage-related minor tail protein|tara:strand:+ start:277 stop:561 length:285 start_codon:yes stop_codon:yes gene_type:complete